MPIDVRMPDGTLITDVPDNITQADLMARFDAFKAQTVTPTTPVTPQTAPQGAPIPSVLQTPEPKPLNWAGTGPQQTLAEYFGSGDLGTFIRGVLSSDQGDVSKARTAVLNQYGEEILQRPEDFSKAFHQAYSDIKERQKAELAAKEKETPTPGVIESLTEFGKQAIEHPLETAKTMIYDLGKDPEYFLNPASEAAKIAQTAKTAATIGEKALASAKGVAKAGAIGATGAAARQAGEMGLGERQTFNEQEIANQAANFAALHAAGELVAKTVKAGAEQYKKAIAPPEPRAEIAEPAIVPEVKATEEAPVIPEAKPVEPAETTIKAPVSESHDAQAMLDELSGKEVEYKPEEEVKPIEAPKEEPTGVISETEKEFVPVGGRLINKADVDKLGRESAMALQQNLETQAIEKEKLLKREAREEKFKEPPTQTLSAKLVEEGGIARDQKRDMLGETGKIEGYDHVFREKGNDLLTLVKDGKLDDYLPPELRTTATPPDGLYDARPGYNYISDLMKTGEKVHHYDYEMAKLQHENMVYEKNLAKQQMEPNEAARAAAAEIQGKIYLSEGKVEGGSTPEVITDAVKNEFGSEGNKLLDNNKLVVVKDINELKDKGYIGDRINQLTNNTRAFYDPITDRSYFISDRIKPNEVRAMALHEIGTHYGMKKMLGDTAYKNVLNSIETLHTKDKAVRAAWDETLKSYAHLLEDKKPIFLEEVLAHLGETAPNHPLWKRVLMKVKEFLIKHNIIKNISASELQDLVRTSLSRAAKEEKAPEITTPSDIAASQRPPLNIKGEPVEPQWHGPEESKIDTWLYRLQNKQIDTKRVQEAIKEIGDNWNVYEKEQLYHGRTATGIRDFLLKELLPAVKDIQKLKLTTEDIRTYLHNRHAEERNNQMNKINPDIYDPKTNKTIPNPLKDKGSGIPTDKAKEYLKNLDADKKKALEDIAQKFDEMIRGTQRILINSGAESKETINKWNKTYKHYVPLFRVEDEMARPSGMSGVGQGFGTRGAFSKRAMGSERDVQDIISNIIAQRERAIIRAEKIRVGRGLYGLAIQNPNPDFWMPINPDAIRSKAKAVAELNRMGIPDAKNVIDNLMAEPKERYLKKTRPSEEGVEPEEDFDFDSGLPVNESKEVVASKVNVMSRYKDFVFPVRVNGKDRYVFFNKNDPRALRMVQALKNLDVEQLGFLESWAGKFTRWFKNVNTQYNPVFGFVNLLRDYQGALFNLSNTEIAGKQAAVTKNIYPAMRGILNVHRSERKGVAPKEGPWAKLYQEARAEGFQTGYRDSLIRNQEEMQIVDHLLAQFEEKGMKANTKKAFYAVAGALTDFNDVMENAIRLAAYKVATTPKNKGGAGLSKQKAAIIAKNLTVNFDKKGAWTSQINALYAFFNASVQGTERIYRTLKGPAKNKIIGGGIAAGVIQAILLANAGYDENDPPEFVREKNFIVPLPDGKYFTIPYPLGFNVLPNIGRITTDFVVRGGQNPGKHVAELTGSIMDSFNPLGSTGFSMQTIAPTVLDPFAALAENKDAFGRPIYRPDRATAPTPGYTRSRDTASELGKGISYYLNLASNGSKYQKGFISPTADEVDFLAGQIGGGLYRETAKAVKAATSPWTGEEIPAYRRPVVGRFMGETGSNAAISQTFYENVTRMTDHENEIKGRMKNQENVEAYLKSHPEARLWKRANTVENKINELNKRKRLFIERKYPQERIQAIDAQKAMYMKRFNDQYSRARAE